MSDERSLINHWLIDWSVKALIKIKLHVSKADPKATIFIGNAFSTRCFNFASLMTLGIYMRG